MQEYGLPVGRDLIILKSEDIYCLMYGSMRYVVSMGHGWCDQFMN